MTLDQFQTQWSELDRKLDAIVQLNRHILAERLLNRTRTVLQRQTIFAVANAISTWVVIPLMGWFIAKHRAEPGLIAAAAAIALYFAAQLIAQIKQVRALASVDYGDSIAVIQRQLDAVAKMRIRLVRWIVMSAGLLWVPTAVVMAGWVWGIDLTVIAPGWLVANAIFGVVWMAAVHLWSRRRGATRANADSLQSSRLVRDVGGDNSSSAEAFMSALAEFEKEEKRATARV